MSTASAFLISSSPRGSLWTGVSSSPTSIPHPAPAGVQDSQSRLPSLHSTGWVAAAVSAVAISRVGVRSANLGRTRRRRRQMPAHSRAATVVRMSGDVTGNVGDEKVFDAVVIGTGVSGLCAAHQLKKLLPDATVMVTEARDRIGGNITTRTDNGRLWEEGPNSFQPSDALLEVACDVGLQDDILLADPDSYRFVWWDKRLRALPATPLDAVVGDFLSWPGKIRAGLGLLGIRPPVPNKEESIREFVSRNLGDEAFERLIDPFVSGVYAGDPNALSAEAAIGKVQALEKEGGSLLGGVLKTIKEKLQSKEPTPPRDPRLPEVKGQTVGSFRGGLKQFAEALGDRISQAGAPVQLEWKLSNIGWDAKQKEYMLEYDTPEGPRRVRSRAVVLTAPAYVAADLLKPLSSSAAATLQEIRYPRVAAVNVEYPRSAFREPEHGRGPVNGFGQLHPRSQGIRTLGTIYCSSLFPGREPDPDKVMLLHYIGGARDEELFGGIDSLSDEQLVEAVHKDNVKTMLKPSAANDLPNVLGVRVWPKAIPQANIGHLDRLASVKKDLESAGFKGLFLAGNYVGGVALGQCVEFGLEVAQDVAKFVEPRDS